MIDVNVLSFQYTYIYVAINLFCIFVSFLLLSKFSFRVGSSREIFLFHAMNSVYLGYLVLEIIWVLSLMRVIDMPDLATGLIKMLDSMLIPIVVYLWFWFAEERFRSKLTSYKCVKVLLVLPIIVMIILYLTSFFTGLVFKITPELTVANGPIFYLSGIIDNIYGFAIITHGVILSLKENNRFEKKYYWTHIIFISICTFAGVFDALYKTTPVMTLAITYSFIYLYVTQLQPHIFSAYNDALTGLNNRRSADKCLLDSIEKTTPDNPFYLFMMDIDRFKEINDTLGHLEGDRALKVVADAIDAVTKDFKGFAARWGGDEFVIVVRHAKEESFPEAFAKALDDKIQHHVKLHFIKYPLGMSIGHAICESTKETISNMIDVADKMLYQNKLKKLSEYEG